MSFRYDIGRLAIDVRNASPSLRGEIRRHQITARCGRLQASGIWPAHAAKLTFGLGPKPAPGNVIPTDPKPLRRFNSCEITPIPGVDPIVSAPMHPRARG